MSRSGSLLVRVAVPAYGTDVPGIALLRAGGLYNGGGIGVLYDPLILLHRHGFLDPQATGVVGVLGVGVQRVIFALRSRNLVGHKTARYMP